MSGIANFSRSYKRLPVTRTFSSLRGRFHLILHISSRLGIPTDCSSGVVSTFAILTPVPPPTTSANSPDSRPNLSHLSHFLSQILFVSLSALNLFWSTFFFGLYLFHFIDHLLMILVMISNHVCLTSLSLYI